MKRLRYIILGLLVAMSSQAALTRVTGVTMDHSSGEPLPFVQIMFDGSTIGTTSDLDGNFTISNERGLISLSFRSVGYKTKVVTVKPNKSQEIFVVMEPEVYALTDVVVKPDKTRERYRRKGNPAVELIKNVIANKDKNRVESQESYMMETYEKLSMAIEPFDYDLDKNRFWRDFKFLEEYVDTMQLERGVLVVDSGKVQVDSIMIGEDSVQVNVDSVVILRNEDAAKREETTILTLSLRETLSEDYVSGFPRKERQIVVAKRWEGLDELFDNGGMSQNIKAMFQPVNIFQNDVNVMLNRFVSPLSSSLAVSFYHYYIMDTIIIEDTPCIDLAFVPVNSQSFGFTGHLYIVNDSSYALKRYTINIPPSINMNWVSHLSIAQTFYQLPDGMRISTRMLDLPLPNARNIIFMRARHATLRSINLVSPCPIAYSTCLEM